MKKSSPIIRIQEIEIQRFKSTTAGTLSMPSVVRKQHFDHQADILGIYGQNGTGKSAVVEALSLIQRLFEGQSIPKQLDRLISIGSHDCAIRVKFLVKMGDLACSFDYKVQLARQLDDSSEEDESSQPVFISQESLHCAEWNSETKRYRTRVELFCYDSNQYDCFSPKKTYETVLEQQEGNRLDIAIPVALAQHQRKSIIMSQRLASIIIKTAAEAGQQSRNVQLLRIFCEFMEFYAKVELFVVTNFQCTLAQSHHGVSFYIRQQSDSSKKCANIYIKLQQTDLITSSQYEALQNSIESINVVLTSIIPQLQIELYHHGEEIDSEGNAKVRVQLLSLRGETRIPLQDESSGIIKIISILSALLHIYHNPGACLVVDELDSGIFEYLLGELLDLFEQEAQGQLIFTSHNLRALETLHKDSLIFSTTNPHNRYIRMKNVKTNNNLRDMYYRTILLGGQNEELYAETDRVETARAFRRAAKNLQV